MAMANGGFPEPRAWGVEMRKCRELVVVRTAGGKTQRRPAGRHDWTQAKEAKFLEVLAGTCNVTLAAKRARVGNSTVYTRRAKDAAFRDGWARAIAQGYARLEIETLERAINGEMRTITLSDKSTEVRVEYNDRVALTLLRMHRDVADEPARREDAAAELGEDGADELRDKLMAKLKRVRVQLLGAKRAEEDGWDAIGPPALTLDADDGRDGQGEVDE